MPAGIWCSSLTCPQRLLHRVMDEPAGQPGSHSSDHGHWRFPANRLCTACSGGICWACCMHYVVCTTGAKGAGRVRPRTCLAAYVKPTWMLVAVVGAEYSVTCTVQITCSSNRLECLAMHTAEPFLATPSVGANQEPDAATACRQGTGKPPSSSGSEATSAAPGRLEE